MMPRRLTDKRRTVRRQDRSRSVLGRMWRLTPAERRAVQGLVDGLRTSEIAASLGRSVHTIRTQLKRSMAKAGVHSQAALVARVLASRTAHTPLG
jgi:DNA-binding CsgD family transcriptional regulator